MGRLDGPELHRPFRPRAARRVASTMAVVVLAGTALLVVVLPGATRQAPEWGLVGAFGVLGAVLAWSLLRHAAVRADPDEDGLTVRNVVRTHRVTWPQVVSVRFGHGRPWAQLDLADGQTLAVMAVQGADGAFGTAEATRLATLVALHSRTARDD